MLYNIQPIVTLLASCLVHGSGWPSVLTTWGCNWMCISYRTCSTYMLLLAYVSFKFTTITNLEGGNISNAKFGLHWVMGNNGGKQMFFEGGDEAKWRRSGTTSLLEQKGPDNQTLRCRLQFAIKIRPWRCSSYQLCLTVSAAGRSDYHNNKHRPWTTA